MNQRMIENTRRKLVSAMIETQTMLAKQEAHMPLPEWSTLEQDRQKKIAFYRSHIAKLSAMLDALPA